MMAGHPYYLPYQHSTYQYVAQPAMYSVGQPVAAVAEPEEENLCTDLKRLGLTTLVAMGEEAGLHDSIIKAEPATIFAPSNLAFAKALSNPKVQKAIQDDPDMVKKHLMYHVIPGVALTSAQLNSSCSMKTANGAPLR